MMVFQSPVIVRSDSLPVFVSLLVIDVSLSGSSCSSGLSISYLLLNSRLLFLDQLYFLSLLGLDLSLSIVLEVILDASVSVIGSFPFLHSLGIRAIFSVVSSEFLSVSSSLGSNSSVLIPSLVLALDRDVLSSGYVQWLDLMVLVVQVVVSA